MAGGRSGTSSAGTWRNQGGDNAMCTTISCKTPMSASGKGVANWFSADHVYLAYDHPSHAPDEHAVLIDFVNETGGARARVAIELSRDAARKLAASLLEVVHQAEIYEGDST